MADEEKILQYLVNPLSLIVRPDLKLLEKCLEEYPYFQSVRVLYLLAKNHEEGIFTKSILQKTAVYAGDRAHLYRLITTKYNQYYQLEESFEPKVVSHQAKKLESEIIDRFLEKRPQITRPKAEFYNAAEKAAKSIMEEEEFVSETLAGIYVRLKKYDKAISIYKKLSFIYPEKSNYFALLINNLENKINE